MICCDQTPKINETEEGFIVIDKVVGLLRELCIVANANVNTEENRNDLEQLRLVLIVFETIFSDMQDLILSLSAAPSTAAENLCIKNHFIEPNFAFNNYSPNLGKIV